MAGTAASHMPTVESAFNSKALAYSSVWVPANPPAGGAPCVGHQNVDATQRLGGLLDERTATVHRGHVCPDADDVAAAAADRVDRGVEARLVAAADGHPHPVGRQRLCRCEAQPAR